MICNDHWNQLWLWQLKEMRNERDLFYSEILLDAIYFNQKYYLRLEIRLRKATIRGKDRISLDKSGFSPRSRVPSYIPAIPFFHHEVERHGRQSVKEHCAPHCEAYAFASFLTRLYHGWLKALKRIVRSTVL